jgi:hypothetical protein
MYLEKPEVFSSLVSGFLKSHAFRIRPILAIAPARPAVYRCPRLSIKLTVNAQAAEVVEKASGVLDLRHSRQRAFLTPMSPPPPIRQKLPALPLLWHELHREIKLLMARRRPGSCPSPRSPPPQSAPCRRRHRLGRHHIAVDHVCVHDDRRSPSSRYGGADENFVPVAPNHAAIWRPTSRKSASRLSQMCWR